MVSERHFAEQQAKYRFLAKRLAARLPPATVAMTGGPDWQLEVTFNPGDETAINAAIRDIVTAVELKGVTRYVALPMATCVENEARVIGRDVAVTLRRFFDVQKREMVTRFYVAGA